MEEVESERWVLDGEREVEEEGGIVKWVVRRWMVGMKMISWILFAHERRKQKRKYHLKIIYIE